MSAPAKSSESIKLLHDLPSSGECWLFQYIQRYYAMLPNMHGFVLLLLPSSSSSLLDTGVSVGVPLEKVEKIQT